LDPVAVLAPVAALDLEAASAPEAVLDLHESPPNPKRGKQEK